MHRRKLIEYTLTTINYINRGAFQGGSKFLDQSAATGSHPTRWRPVYECMYHKHKNKFLRKKNDLTKQFIIDILKENNIKYKKSWTKTKLFPLLYSF